MESCREHRITPSQIQIFILAVACLGCVKNTLQDMSPCSSWHNATCTACLGEPLTLTCGENHTVIGFVHAGFGRSITSRGCSPQPHDCLAQPVPLMTEIFRCLWKQSSCMFTLARYHFPRGNVCNFTLTPHYLVTSHTHCVHDSYLHSMCQDPGRHLTVDSDVTAYLTSPNFEQPYSQNMRFDLEDCWLTLHPTSGYGVCLESLSMDLPPKDPRTGICKGDYLEISWTVSDSEHSAVYCGDDVISLCLFLSDVTLVFVITLENHVRHGFAIHYYRVKDALDSDVALISLPSQNTSQHVAVTIATGPYDPHAQVTKVVVIVFVSLVILFGIAMATVCTLCVLQRRERRLRGRAEQAGMSGVRFVTLKDTAATTTTKTAPERGPDGLGDGGYM